MWSFFNQHFENENLGKFESEGWISFTEEGTPYWKVVEDEYALGRSASFSAYSSGDTETIGWLITPPINASSINNPVFAFKYIGNGKSTYDATFLVDDIRVMEGNQ